MIRPNIISKFRSVTVVGFVLAVAATRLGAQIFSIAVTNPPGPVPASNSFTYTVSVTNRSGIVLDGSSGTQPPAWLTNSFSGPVQWQSASVLQGSFYAGVIYSNASSLVFDLGNLPILGVAVVSVTVLPTAAGTITNTLTAVAVNYSPPGMTNYVITNVVTSVTSALGPTNGSADLAVSLAGPLSSIITNDWMTYSIIVTNLGTNDASNVILSNTLPAGVGYISVWPTNLTLTSATNGVVVFNLGTIANGAVTNLALRVQPANAGTQTFTSVVGSQDVPDPNPTNNVASTDIVVTNFLSGLLTVSLIDATQQFNPQTGMMQQRVSLSNVDTNPVSFTRVTVLGLTNWMFNAAGTNNGNPFVLYPTILNTNESVELLLEYFNVFGFPVPFTSLQANEVPFVSLAPPSPPWLGTSIPLGSTNFIQLTDGDVMLEFPSFTNRSYTIVYYDNGASTNPMVAMPSYLSPANWVQWIDYGPPKTITHPTNTVMRSYSVFLNP